MITIEAAKDTRRATFTPFQIARQNYYQQIYHKTLGYPLGAVNALVQGQDIASWRNPNRAVGSDRTGPNQRFSNARVAVARDDRADMVPQGFAYFAENASGNFLEARAKLHLPLERFQSRRYRVIRELIAPDLGLAKELIIKALEDAAPEQPKTAYVFDEEDITIAALTRLGFRFNEEFAEDQQSRRPILKGDEESGLPDIRIRRYDLAPQV